MVEIKISEMKNLTKIGGVALITGAILQITRMIPIAMSDGIKMMENFPPHNLEDTLFAAQATGWHISHMMVFIASPLLFFGFYEAYKLSKVNSTNNIGLLGLIGLAIGIILYTIGACIDGLTLAELSHRVSVATGSEKDILGQTAIVIHELAISFGGPAFAFLLISTGFLGLSFLNLNGFKLISYIAIAIGVISTLGYLLGVLDIMVTDSFIITGGLTMFMFFFYLGLGIKMLKIKN